MGYCEAIETGPLCGVEKTWHGIDANAKAGKVDQTVDISQPITFALVHV